MFETALAIHLIGAIGLAVIILVSIISIINNSHKRLKNLVVLVGLSSGLQLVTGSLLVINSDSGTLLSFCSNIGLYLSIIVITELILFYKIKNIYTFPLKTVISPTAVGMLFVVFALILRF